MLTSESNDQEFKSFFEEHTPILVKRLLNLINKKYGHSLVKKMQQGVEFPPIFGTYKVGDITIYGYPIGLKHTSAGFYFENMHMFLIMKDLRKQTKIMVTNSEPYSKIYNTHAISRYKERIGLEEGTDLIGVCKNMVLAGCCSTCSIINNVEIYGSDPNNKTLKIICTKGAFLGYMSSETKVVHAETFLSTNELREDQQYLNASQNPYLQKWKEVQELYLKGKVSSEAFEEIEKEFPNNRSVKIENGHIQLLSEEEIKKDDEKMDQFLKAFPQFYQYQAAINRRIPMKRLQRKGYM